MSSQSNSSNPIISVIIPTYNRGDMLRNAISSVIEAYTDIEFEVLVIPNGESKIWEKVRESFVGDHRVRWSPILTAHACAARNHGLKQARSEFVRFLDDDDLLLPDARAQLEELMGSGCNLSTAPFNIKDIKGQLRIQEIPKTNDYVTAFLLSIGINNMTAGCIFHKSLLTNVLWREDLILHDDYFWILNFAKNNNLIWHKFERPVGVYRQHNGERLSSVNVSLHNSKQLIDEIIDVKGVPAETNNISQERQHAAAIALLTHAHTAFLIEPLFFSKIINMACKISKTARPLQPIFKYIRISGKVLLIFEWIVFPARIAAKYFNKKFVKLNTCL